MHRALARAAAAGSSQATRAHPARVHFAAAAVATRIGSCRCYTAGPDQADPAEKTPTYSLPQDAFDSLPDLDSSSSDAASPLAGPSAPRATIRAETPQARRRQRQTLSNAEAQAFADLLGEIMPRSAAQPSSSASTPGSSESGLFGMFSNAGAASADPSAGPGTSVEGGVSKVHQALMRKVGHKIGIQLDPGSGRWARKARTELTEQEELELDRLREELIGLKSDHEVLKWGLENVFGYSVDSTKGTMLFPDPATLPVEIPSTAATPGAADPDAVSSKPQRGPSSRMYPDLLLLMFVVLRDTHRNPSSALSLFHLAKSNPFSYINGCTTALYLEVLRTHWADGAGDVEAVLGALDEMRANGVPFDDKVRELVRSIGEAIRIDQDRTELRLERDVQSRGLTFASPEERERQVLVRRWFDSTQVGAWSRMERIVEENQDELEDARRLKEDERWHDSERARRDRFASERDQAYRDRPDLMPRPASSASSTGATSPWDAPVPSLYSGAAVSSRPSRTPTRRPGLSTGADGLDQRPWETWQVPTMERDADGNLVMPKRPSFVNPFKIRRKGLTKEEKARKDTKHPALWWKK